MRVLVLGGTADAVALAAALVERGHAVTTSLAGRTREPRPVAGAVRTGGFGGVAGLTDYLLREYVDVLVDATHPFASTISANAALAATRSRTRRLALHRPPWDHMPGDEWRTVPDGEAAARALPSGARALLALGRQHLAPFAARGDVSFVVRAIEPFEPPFPATVLLSRPSADPAEEAAMLRAHAITHLVSRNSGGAGAYAKIAAARMLGLPVIVIDRPLAPPPPLVRSVKEAMAAIDAMGVGRTPSTFGPPGTASEMSPARLTSLIDLGDRGVDRLEIVDGALIIEFDLFHCDDVKRNVEGYDYPLHLRVPPGGYEINLEYAATSATMGEVLDVSTEDGLRLGISISGPGASADFATVTIAPDAAITVTEHPARPFADG